VQLEALDLNGPHWNRKRSTTGRRCSRPCARTDSKGSWRSGARVCTDRVSVLRAARDRGLRVPEDLSVVGFDDIEPATLVTPALTTVRQPLGEMGRTAVNVLVRLLEGRASTTPHIELATRLVVRELTAPPRRSAASA
jgi:Periplasmic binding protein-like domain